MKAAPAAMVIEIGRIKLGKNYVDRNDIEDLAKSIAAEGLLQPILVRPTKKDPEQFEVVCGTRRFQACTKLEHTHIACVIRDLSDDEVSIAQLVENSQRIDAHPLDEAEAYAKLQKSFKVEDIAAKVGRGVQYVRDRVRLNELVADAKQAFRLGWIELGHAIALSRLTAKNQKRAFESGLFEPEQLVLLPDAKQKGGRKARTVGELQGWIDSHVNFDAGAPVVTELFPKTAEYLKEAEANAARVLRITHDLTVDDDAKASGEKVYTSRSWIRADGEKKSKPCDHAVLGLVTIGPGRGDSFLVCVSKSCEVHRPAQAKAAKAKAKHGPASKVASKAELKAQKEIAKQRAAQDQAEADRKAFDEAKPAILAEVIKQLGKIEVKPTGKLADALVSKVTYLKPASEMPRGKDAKSFLRFLAYLHLNQSLTDYWAHRDFPKMAKSIGLRLERVLPKPHATAPAKPSKGSDEE